MSFKFHIAFPVDSDTYTYAVAIRSTSKNQNHRVCGGSPSKSDLRVGSGADAAIKIAPTTTNFFEFTPFPNKNFNNWLENRKAEDIGPADFYTSGKSDGAACAFAWLLGDDQPDFNENDKLPIIFVSCAIEKEPPSCALIVKRVAGDRSGLNQLQKKLKIISEIAKIRQIVLILHSKDAELLIENEKMDTIFDVLSIKDLKKSDLPALFNNNSGKTYVIKVDSGDFDYLAYVLGTDSNKFKRDYEMKKTLNDFVHIFFSHDRNKTEVEEDQLENLITKNPLALKAIFESDNEAQKRQTLILLKNLVSRKPSAVQLLAQAYQSARSSVDYLREESQKNPDKYLRTFAGSLMILASCYRDEGNLEESLKNIIEAVEIRKYLYQKNPEIFTPTLAGTLNSLSAAYSNVGKYENALDATKEAIELYRTLTESDPLKYKPILRGTLYCLAACYKYFDKNNEAKNAMDEAASLVRE